MTSRGRILTIYVMKQKKKYVFYVDGPFNMSFQHKCAVYCIGLDLELKIKIIKKLYFINW